MPNTVVTGGSSNDRFFIAFLDASEMHVGFWGSVRVKVDPFTNPLGAIFSFYFYWDVGMAHPNTVSLVNFGGAS